MVGGGTFMIKSNPTPAGWATHKLENNYITEFLPQDPEIWAPCQDPQPGVCHWEKELLEHLAWKPAGLECRSSTGLGEIETLFLEGQTYLQDLEGLLGREGLAVAHCRNKDTGGRGPREYSSAWALLEVTTVAPRTGPTQQPAGSSAGTPQAKKTTGWEHSLTHQQTGCLKSSWAHSHL